MNATVKSLGIDRLGLNEPLQLAELEQRIAEDDTHPNATIAWDGVKASVLASLKR
jgi:hypothetical protein